MKRVWLIGASQMAQDYCKILNSLETEIVVIGRGENNVKSFEEATGIPVKPGGITSFLKINPQICTHAIVAVGMESLYQTTKELIEYGVTDILVEKPGSMYEYEFEDLNNLIIKKDINVYVAYNRRFYASVLKAKDLIAMDGGVISFNFEFTEWSHVIEPLEKAKDIKENWFLGNSTHVIDLAFYLGGKPKEFSSFTSGGLSWHPLASVFVGSGKSCNGALFSYQANWESAGRWSIEILTKEHRLIFRPLEKLQIQKRGTIKQDFDESINYSMDEEHKPGVYLQTKKFLDKDYEDMCSFEEQFNMMKNYIKILNSNN